MSSGFVVLLFDYNIRMLISSFWTSFLQEQGLHRNFLCLQYLVPERCIST